MIKRIIKDRLKIKVGTKLKDALYIPIFLWRGFGDFWITKEFIEF